MADVFLKVPEDVRREAEVVLGKEMSYPAWQLLFSRFLNEELIEKLKEVKRIESIVSRSLMTEEQAEKLAEEASLSIAEKFLSSSGVSYPEKKK
jgi:hypothetical protein